MNREKKQAERIKQFGRAVATYRRTQNTRDKDEAFALGQKIRADAPVEQRDRITEEMADLILGE